MSANGLPSGWSLSALDDFCDVIQGQSPPGDTYNEEGVGLPFFQGKAEFGDLYPTPGKWCNAPAKIAEKDDVLISVRAPVGPTNLCPEEACIGRGLAAIRPLGGGSPRYVLYALRNTADQLRAQATGSTFEAISGEQLRRHRVPFAPVAEQNRIVAEIEKSLTDLDAAVAALKRVQANLKRYRASVLKAACEGRLVPTEAELARQQGRSYETGERLLALILKERRTKWEADQLAKMLAAGKPPNNDDWKKKYKKPTSPDTTNLPELPDGWTWATVEQLNPGERPCAYGVLQPGPHKVSGVPLVRVGDINDGNVSESLKKIDAAIANAYPRTRLCGGEVLLALVGATIGKTALVPPSLAGANTARAVGVIPITDTGVHARWVEIWFRNPEKVSEMKRTAHEVARATLNLEDVRVAAVALPPSAEQLRLISELDRSITLVQASVGAVETQLVKADRLRQAILKRAFEGKLVPQDPTTSPPPPSSPASTPREPPTPHVGESPAASERAGTALPPSGRPADRISLSQRPHQSVVRALALRLALEIRA